MQNVLFLIASACTVTGFASMVLAMQLCAGVPPFHREIDPEPVMRRAAPFLFGMLATMAPAAMVERAMIAALEPLSVLAGLQIRRLVRDLSGGPFPWVATVLTPWIVVSPQRLAMPPFDLRSPALAAPFCALILL